MPVAAREGERHRCPPRRSDEPVRAARHRPGIAPLRAAFECRARGYRRAGDWLSRFAIAAYVRPLTEHVAL
jgi:hypothetical protein